MIFAKAYRNNDQDLKIGLITSMMRIPNQEVQGGLVAIWGNQSED